MEVRINNHGKNALSTKVFFSDESGFEVASLIVMGKTDATLIDAQWTLSNAHRVVAEILETGKQLKTIYVTHAHPDHYFGLGPIADAFPQARVIALPEVARTAKPMYPVKPLTLSPSTKTISSWKVIELRLFPGSWEI
jgi:glyoxylase-like metal-dependent hydrolase (beta-lactamase superfamily II)